MNLFLPLLLLINLPLAGFLINFLLGPRLPKSLVGIIGSATILGSFICTLVLFGSVSAGGSTGSSVYNFFQWIAGGGFSVDFAFLVDRLSVMMLLIITGIGFLIHIYSIGYMHDDKGFHRFMAYLNLFIFFMQFLVLGANYLITFIGWEGVGLCSYLLIGFWFKNQEYNNAAKKAFIMNRIGDLGFLIGLFWIISTFHTLNYNDISAYISNYHQNPAQFPLNLTVVGIITILLFIGATGKSAQIPLYTWLPDAMAGPTPVSALIHAATMVTAGIFLIVRSHALFHLAPMTMDIIAVIGVATSLFAATIGLAQNDIKKVLAYSTVSQLGLMFTALGCEAYSTAMFHLTTHAFFKALLFLGAGSVIHAMSGEQDIRKMGALRKKLPITYITFLIATLAISGIPPFSGFFSKDEILAKAFEKNPVLWAVGAFSSVLTAVYMFRLFYLTFFGKFRGTEEQAHHLHESPSTMTIPLIVLSILAAIGGFIGIPEIFGMPHKLNEYLAPVLSDIADPANTEHGMSHSMELTLMAISSALAIIAAFATRKPYSRDTAEGMEDEKQGAFTRLLAHKYYVDEIYDTLIVRPVDYISNKILRPFDIMLDNVVSSVGRAVNFSGQYVRRLQSGNIGMYIFGMVIGVLLILLLNSGIFKF